MKRLLVSLALSGILAVSSATALPALALENASIPPITVGSEASAGRLSAALQTEISRLAASAEEHGYRLQLLVINDSDRPLDDVIRANLDQRGAALSVLVALERRTEQGLTPSVRVMVSDELSSYLSPDEFETAYREVFLPERAEGHADAAIVDLLGSLDNTIQATREAEAAETAIVVGFFLLFFLTLLLTGARSGGSGGGGYFISSLGDSFGSFDSFDGGGGGGFSGGDS